MAEDNIIFEDVKSPMENMKWNFPEKDEAVVPNIIPGRYYNLYSELTDKCNPSKFMAEYNHDRISIANDIYTKTSAASVFDDDLLKELRKRAMMELGIKFSTEMIYKELTDLLRPSKYSGTEQFNDANDLYYQVISNADDIEELERVQEEAKQKDFYHKQEEVKYEQVEPMSSVSLSGDEQTESKNSHPSQRKKETVGDIIAEYKLFFILLDIIVIILIFLIGGIFG